ncbi:LA_2272 family surface repeat-containing protein [Bacteroidota bacterium]
MRKILFAILILLSIKSFGQLDKTRPILWVIPSVDTQINGIAAGLIINSLKDTDSTLITEINGLSCEIIGVGVFLPLAPSSPIYETHGDNYYSKELVDSIVQSYNYVKYRVNGISCSTSGICGHDIHVNGVNFSGLSTLTGKTNGFSACILININGVVNGVSIGGLINNTIQSKGLQIGLFNKTKNLKGIQIGLWNENEKRSFPIINWDFE